MTDWYSDLTVQPDALEGEPAPDWYGDMTGAKSDPRKFYGPRKVSQDTEGAADISDVAIASLAEEAPAKIRYFSEQMGIPEENFGVVNEQFVYVTPDGGMQAVEPGFLRGFVSGVGPSFPAVLAAAGTALGTPLGPAGMAAGGVTGATAGQTLRDYLAKVATGQEMTPGRPIREGAYDLAATAAGLFVGKGVTRSLATKAGKAVEKYVKEAGVSAVDALKQAADDMGIKLTPAELTNATTLRSQQKALSSLPKSAEVLDDFYSERGKQTSKVVGDYLDDVSPIDNPEVAGETARAAANAVEGGLKELRFKQGSPAYRKAFRDAPDIDLKPTLEAVEAKMGAAGRTTRQYLNRVKNELYETAIDPATGKAMKDPETGEIIKTLRTDLEGIQNAVKEEMDNLIGKAQRAGHGKAASALLDIQHDLLKTLDDASPDFQSARALWGDMSGSLSRAQAGILGAVAKTKDTDLGNVARHVFKSGPRSIREARTRMLATEGGEEAWNGLVRGHLQDTFESAGKIAYSNISKPQVALASQGPRWWAKLYGDPMQKARLKAAMSPDQFKALSKIMNVLEASGRAMDLNSDTAFKQEALRAMRDSTGGGVMGNIDKINPLRLLQSMNDMYREFRFGKNVEVLAKAITSPDSIAALKGTYGVSNTSVRSAVAVFKALNIGRASVTHGPESDFLPPVLTKPTAP